MIEQPKLNIKRTFKTFKQIKTRCSVEHNGTMYTYFPKNRTMELKSDNAVSLFKMKVDNEGNLEFNRIKATGMKQIIALYTDVALELISRSQATVKKAAA